MGYKATKKVIPSVLMSLFSKNIPSPLGQLTLVAEQNHLVAILWKKENAGRVKLASTQINPLHPILRHTQKQLQEYFSGKRKTYDIWHCLHQDSSIFHHSANQYLKLYEQL
jgi:O6-methylguanine-DNA--protein-cysteine methyltransferase